jgi:hypothetical protein
VGGPVQVKDSSTNVNQHVAENVMLVNSAPEIVGLAKERSPLPPVLDLSVHLHLHLPARNFVVFKVPRVQEVSRPVANVPPVALQGVVVQPEQDVNTAEHVVDHGILAGSETKNLPPSPLIQVKHSPERSLGNKLPWPPLRTLIPMTP